MKKSKLDAKTIEKLISAILAIIFFTLFAIFNILGLDTVPLAIIFPIVIIIGIILFAVISIIVVATGKKREASKLLELKKVNMTNDLRLEVVYGTQNKLLIVAGYDIDDKHYKFISTYEGDAVEFAKLVEDNNITTIKTWIDFTNPNVYDFDINDLFTKVGKSPSLVSSTTYGTDNLESANEMINYFKSIM